MKSPVFTWHLLMPRYWPIWLCVIPLFYLLSRLPWSVQHRLGTALGRFIYKVIGQRRRDTETNLALCFPEKSAEERQWMAEDVFVQGGIALFETANAWFKPKTYYHRKVTIEGLHLLQAAQAEGKGVLLLGAHYSFVDLCGLLAIIFFQVDTVYRPQNNKALEYFIVKRRLRIYDYQIDHDNMRLLIKALKENHVVWYTPDQDFGLKQGVFAPFFGIQAATLTAPRRLQKINDSVVMFIHFRRHPTLEQYEILITPPLADYPTDDVVADATRVNQQLETLIRRSPTQYMWFHRRFKTRPDGEAMPYPKKKRHLKQELAEAATQTKENQ
ncbi:LpxL/LpxP family Kdo(2)-lipid IV(A) lauroyl/palmitoleoyl acyltransferase [Agitococcus lubricus]|uniref:Lipid A biosynthesis acyltransferase n=1 Tax=Agitococcus lubricus TaxID=1077255 RepID=A0A2T5J0Y2_9GAMM|nr:LpxL/LpxP family Kdo(2)-lipid IV(A) lauroyl/palmitoleoyl acyltransferase [Agitococcus lubricus]PTQ90023.1 KDO2-lipid IV(A) lauroyltransferase [Agitococcus lubricus]